MNNRNDRVRRANIESDYDDEEEVFLSDVTEQVFGNDFSPSYVERNEMLDTLNRSIVPIDKKRWRFGRFELTPTELIFPDELQEDEVVELGKVLSKMDSSIHFWLGDWVNSWIGDEEDNKKRGEAYNYLAERFGFSVKTLQNVSSVCRNLPSSLRREDLNFTIHRIVAEVNEKLKGKEFKLLAWAADNNASSRGLLDHIKELLHEEEVSDDNFLFSKSRFPKLNPRFLELQWAKARNQKDSEARTLVLGEIAKIRKWLEDLENSLDN